MRSFFSAGVWFPVVVFLFSLAGWAVIAHPVDAATVDVTITSTGGGGGFSPQSVTINTGDTIRWTNNDTVDAEPSSDNHPFHENYPDPFCSDQPNNCFDKPDFIPPSGTWSYTFQISGTWGYHNHLKPGKTGTITITDLNTPPAVTNLAASATASDSIYLSWTSPGDDQGTYVKWGTPGSFDIRYRTDAAITEVNWATATQVSGEPAPQAAGASQNMTVTGLQPSTLYYFALKTNDNNVALTSAISNSPSATSLASGAAPVASPKTPLFTDTQRPNAPTNITAVVGDRFVTFTWVNPLDSDFSSIRLYRSEEKGAIGSIVADMVPGTTYTDRDLTNGRTYYYTVKALDTPAGNESNNTAQVEAVPIGPPPLLRVNGTATPADGGVVSLMSEDGVLVAQLSVPAGVVADETRVTLRTLSQDGILPGIPLPKEFDLIGDAVYEIVVFIEGERAMLVPSASPMKFIITYTDTMRGTHDEASLRLARYDEEQSTWYIPEGVSVDTGQDRIVYLATKLSRFALVVSRDDTPPQVPDKAVSVTEEDGTVTLSWELSDASDVHRVHVFRSSASSQQDELLASVTGTSFRDTTANASAYTYRLVSVDRSGNVSTEAAFVSVASPSLSPVHHDISEGALVRVEGTPHVYIVAKRSGFTLIRHLLDPDVPAFYGHLGPAFWDLVQTVQTLGSSRTVSFIRCQLCLNGGKVFEVNDDGTRHHLAMTWEEFTFRLGNDAAFAQVAVFEVNEQELNHYAEGEAVLP